MLSSLLSISSSCIRDVTSPRSFLAIEGLIVLVRSYLGACVSLLCLVFMVLRKAEL